MFPQHIQFGGMYFLKRWYATLRRHPDNIISVISYFHIERNIVYNEKVQNKTIHELTLLETEITSADYYFELDSVYDMSYRPISNAFGLLYLHTNQGMFTFKVETNPKPFIDQFHQLKLNNK